MALVKIERRQQIATLGGVILTLALFYPCWRAGVWFSEKAWNVIETSVDDRANQTTLVVGPVLRISSTGGSAFALGHDICPGQDSHAMRMLLGEPADAGTPQCIVVTPTTSSVRVSVIADGAIGLAEEWTVKRKAGGVLFRRPDGSLVISN